MQHKAQHTFGFWLAVLAGLLALAQPLAADDRQALRGVALVIGNGDYVHLSDLPNPTNDADAIEALLADLGFDSVRRTDRDAATLARDLERFAEDAAEADVAILYYSGHGIEAGGENFLVPVDADLSALDAASEKLVPIAALIDRLKATVPVAIVMLDACRNSPFPPGSTATLVRGGAPLAVTAGGLAATRGAVSVTGASTAPAEETFGTVLAFAAEPGKVALDGDPGGNSPYAAAVLRHLDAMAGEEFGTVMRMVAEEVYLKTSGAQRPWINESLRRQLYFGEPASDPAGVEGDILRERRQLLVTIAALPDLERRTVETIASRDGVPMDALYAMLKAMGVERPEDPANFEEALRDRADDVKSLLEDKKTLADGDAEIIRLASIRRDAVRDGALDTARSIGVQIAARIAELDKVLSDQESGIRDKRLAMAEQQAESARVAALSFDFEGAAGYYELAFRQVEKWDRGLAWYYRNAQLLSLTDLGNYRGDRRTLERAVDLGEEALLLAKQAGNTENHTNTLINMGIAYQRLGELDADTANLEKAAEVSREALLALDRDSDPSKWALIQSNLGVILRTLGERDATNARLQEAVQALRQALLVRTRTSDPFGWAQTQVNLAGALYSIAVRDMQPGPLREAVAAMRPVFDVFRRDTDPINWAMAQANLSIYLRSLGLVESGTESLREAVAAAEAALSERDRKQSPMAWAQSQITRANAVFVLAMRENDLAGIEQSVAALQAALGVYTRETAPLQWATTQNSLAVSLTALGARTNDTARFDGAKAALQSALQVWTRERVPLSWGAAQANMGSLLREEALRSRRPQDYEAAISAFRQALEVRRRETEAQLWAQTQFDLALVYLDRAELNGPTLASDLTATIAAMQAALTEWTRDSSPLHWASAQHGLAYGVGRKAILDNDVDALRRAVEGFRLALTERTREATPFDWAASNYSLALTLHELAVRTNDIAAARQAVEAHRAALTVWTRDADPFKWAVMNNQLAFALRAVGMNEPGTQSLEQAVAAFENTLSVITRETSEIDWAITQWEIGLVILEIGERRKDRATLERGRQAIEASRDAHHRLGKRELDDKFAYVLGQVDQLMATLK